MATLLRSQRSCCVCGIRAHCSLVQLCLPKRLDDEPFFEWREGWLCSPCLAPFADAFLESTLELTRRAAEPPVKLRRVK